MLVRDLIKAVKEGQEKFMSKPEQEPVACEHKIYGVDTKTGEGHCMKCFATGKMRFVVDEAPQRTWIGLTDEERKAVTNNSMTPACVAIAIEAKLKEKNT